MQIPSQLKIGGFEWQIIEDEDIAYEGNIYGSTHYDTQKIFLKKILSEQKKAQTFLHEIIHAVVWQSGLVKRFNDKEVVPEEHVVAAISGLLYEVLKENKLDFNTTNKTKA